MRKRENVKEEEERMGFEFGSTVNSGTVWVWEECGGDVPAVESH